MAVMRAPDRILVFVPAYRCAAQISRVLEQFCDAAVASRFSEILVVDNRSPDDTVEAALAKARELGLDRITIARNRDNYGLGGSHKAAFAFAAANAFSHIVVLHGDDQGRIRDLLPVLERGDHRRMDCCLGSRFLWSSRLQGYSVIRILGNLVFNVLFSLASLRPLHDLGSGLNIYRVEPLASRYWMGFYDNLMFNYCMILAHVARKDRFMFFPISWREDDQISNVKLVSQARRTLALLFRFLKGRKKFLNEDFRDIRRNAYEFDIVAARL